MKVINSLAGFIILVITITLFDSVFCGLKEYKVEEHVKIVSYKTKVYLTEEWKNSKDEGFQKSEQILQLLQDLYDEYLSLNATYKEMVKEHSEANEELKEIIVEHVEEENEIATCIERECMRSVRNCRFSDVTKTTVETLARDLASAVKQLENQGINVGQLEEIGKAMNRSLKILNERHAKLEERRTHVADILWMLNEALDIVDENEVSLEKILAEAERKTFRESLSSSKEQVLRQIQTFQNILEKSSDGDEQNRRRRAVGSGSVGYIPVLSSMGPADCDEVQEVGGWREFCSLHFPKQCSQSLADHVSSLAEDFKQLNTALEKKQEEFNDLYMTFSTLYADLDEVICDAMQKIVWMTMVTFTDKSDPKFNVTKLTFDPSKYFFYRGGLYYEDAITTLEGWENLEGLSLGEVNVHKYYATAKEICRSVKRSLEKQACLTGPEKVRFMLMEHCPALC